MTFVVVGFSFDCGGNTTDGSAGGCGRYTTEKDAENG